jgi:hypothetical protein
MYTMMEKVNLLQQYHRYTRENERCKGDDPVRLAQLDMRSLSSAQKKQHALKLIHRRSTLVTERTLRRQYTTHCVPVEERDEEHDWQISVELPRLITIYTAAVDALDPKLKARLQKRPVPEYKPPTRASMYSLLSIADEEPDQEIVETKKKMVPSIMLKREIVDLISTYRLTVMKTLEKKVYHKDIVAELQSDDMQLITTTHYTLLMLSVTQSMRSLLRTLMNPEVNLNLVLERQIMEDIYIHFGEETTFKRREALLHSALKNYADEILIGDSLSEFEKDVQNCCKVQKGLKALDQDRLAEQFIPDFEGIHKKRAVQLETTPLKSYEHFMVIDANLIISRFKYSFLERCKQLFSTPGMTILEGMHIQSCVFRVCTVIEEIDLAQAVWRYASWHQCG